MDRTCGRTRKKKKRKKKKGERRSPALTGCPSWHVYSCPQGRHADGREKGGKKKIKKKRKRKEDKIKKDRQKRPFLFHFFSGPGVPGFPTSWSASGGKGGKERKQEKGEATRKKKWTEKESGEGEKTYELLLLARPAW